MAAHDLPGEKEFEVIIVNPDGVVFEGKATRLMAPGISQTIAILPNHTPLYAQLTEGVVEVYLNRQAVKEVSIEGGVLRNRMNRTSIIVGFTFEDNKRIKSNLKNQNQVRLGQNTK